MVRVECWHGELLGQALETQQCFNGRLLIARHFCVARSSPASAPTRRRQHYHAYARHARVKAGLYRKVAVAIGSDNTIYGLNHAYTFAPG